MPVRHGPPHGRARGDEGNSDQQDVGQSQTPSAGRVPDAGHSASNEHSGNEVQHRRCIALLVSLDRVRQQFPASRPSALSGARVGSPKELDDALDE
jgi:hypothetical protein